MKRKAPRAARRGRSKRQRTMNISVPRRIRGVPATSFKRTFWSTNFSPTTASTAGFWQYFTTSFSSLPDATAYLEIFDQYKINGVKYTFRPRYDGFNGENTTDTTLPGVTNQAGCYVYTISDPASTLTPTGTYTSATLNTFLEQGNVKMRPGNKTFSVYFKPQIDNTMPLATARSSPKWLPLTQRTVVHNGFHCFFADVNLTGVFAQSWDIFITLYFQCKGRR